jgi:hypothetical protein
MVAAKEHADVKTPAVKRRLTAHPRFTPASSSLSRSSWLNLVERWFAESTTKKTASRHANQLDPHLDQPRPCVWSKAADPVPDSIAN